MQGDDGKFMPKIKNTKEILDLYDSGLEPIEIAGKLSISVSRVNFLLRTNGVKRRKKKGVKRTKIYQPGQKLGCWIYIGEVPPEPMVIRHHYIECSNCGVIVTRHNVESANNIKGCRNCHLNPKGYVGLTLLWNRYKKTAEKRGGKVNMTKEEFKALTSSDCYYCSSPPSGVCQPAKRNNTDWTKYVFNGIDRIDSSIVDYTLENSVPCCSTCNYAKNDMSLADFQTWIDRLIKFRTGVSNEKMAKIVVN